MTDPGYELVGFLAIGMSLGVGFAGGYLAGRLSRRRKSVATEKDYIPAETEL